MIINLIDHLTWSMYISYILMLMISFIFVHPKRIVQAMARRFEELLPLSVQRCTLGPGWGSEAHMCAACELAGVGNKSWNLEPEPTRSSLGCYLVDFFGLFVQIANFYRLLTCPKDAIIHVGASFWCRETTSFSFPIARIQEFQHNFSFASFSSFVSFSPIFAKQHEKRSNFWLRFFWFFRYDLQKKFRFLSTDPPRCLFRS